MHGAGIALVAVGTVEGEYSPALRCLSDFPQPVGETVRSAVQLVVGIVLDQLVFAAVKCEAASGYAVGEAARNLAGAGPVPEVTLLVPVAEHYVPHDSVAVGNYYRNNTGAPLREHYRGTVFIDKVYHVNSSVRYRLLQFPRAVADDYRIYLGLMPEFGGILLFGPVDEGVVEFFLDQVDGAAAEASAHYP